MNAYRDSDSSHLQVFASHVQIAESLLDVVADSGARLRVPPHGGMDGLMEQQREAWGNLWTQLIEARRIVAAMGRDLTAFDAACARAGDPYLAAAGIGHIKKAMVDAAATAIAALRAAVPEVVIPVSPDSEYRNPVEYVSWTHPAFRWGFLLRMAICFAVLALLGLSLRFF